MDTLTEPALVVFAWGNTSRGDDAAGPILAARLRALDAPGLVVIEDMQLQIEHTADIVVGVPVLFIDASVAISAGFALEPLRPDPDPSVTTHAVSPRALLQLYETAMRTPAPRAWQLHVAGRAFGLGEGQGPESRAATDGAWRFLAELLGHPATQWGRELAAAAGPQNPSVEPAA
ncbi:MAG: hypothetical protein AAFS02_14820 [Pseudomonadota bacterium]